MEHLLDTWGYPALFAFTFISAMGIPVGSEVATAYAGVLASGAVTAPGDHHLSLPVVIVIAIIGEIVGSFAGYAIGYFGGRTLVDRVGRYFLLSHRDLDRAEAWFRRRGDLVAFFGRFIPLLRSFVSFAAGLAEMRVVPFVVATVVACSMWCAALASLGYSLGSSWHHVLQRFSDAGYVAAALFVVLVIVSIWLRVRALRAEQGSVFGGMAGPTGGATGRRTGKGSHARGAHAAGANSHLRRQGPVTESPLEPSPTSRRD
jgi:membrane protein DedA with SNARE-associated domain